ncbi:MAG: hypothetical protein KGL39_49455 [Patescibacteria group bacterium]|nr:hypothetical protein [Patescibacteria group bacterium]
MTESPKDNYAGEKTPGKYAILSLPIESTLYPGTTVRTALQMYGDAPEWYTYDGFSLQGTPLFDSAEEAASFAQQIGMACEIHALPIGTKLVPTFHRGSWDARREWQEVRVWDFEASRIRTVGRS